MKKNRPQRSLLRVFKTGSLKGDLNSKSANTNFRARIKTGFAAGIMLVSSVFNFANAQCNAVAYAVGANNCGIDYISNVTFVSINNSSGCNAFAVNTTNIPNIMMGQTYTLSVSTGGDTEGVRAWIDYNIDGTFNNTPGTELVMGPLYAGTNPATYTVAVTIPGTATPGMTRLRVRCNYASAPSDPVAAQTWGETEDYCVNIISATPCSGLPGANAVTAPTAAICPNNTAALGLANSYTVGGITYAWQYSNLSPVGPWTVIPNATLSSISTPSLNGSTVFYFSSIITCTNGNGSVTATAGSVNVQLTTTNTVPYYENFDGISGVNKLPNCSWAASNMPSACQTYTSPQTQSRYPLSGTSYAAFGPYNIATGQNYFWSNGIWMEAGVTYSTSMWYVTDYYGYINWSLRMWVSPGQSITNASVVATASPASSPAYKSLSNTFTVPTSGLYYMGVNATGSNVCCAGYLSWDDLRVDIPCQLNTPALTLIANTQSICEGQAVNLTATGADTYLWNTGATTSAINVTPQGSTTYTVVGTNAASGCTAVAIQNITVNQMPPVNALCFDPEICAGESTILQAIGAATYMWSNNASTQMITVSPTSNTTYTVIGTNTAGCSANAMVSITVNPLPVVGINSTNSGNLACPEDVTTLTGTGALSYQWNSSSGIFMGSPVTVSPDFSTTYTVYGTDAKGCVGTNVYQLAVTECVGLKNVNASASGIQLYPNPNKGEFFVEVHNKAVKTVEISDLTGRVLMSASSSNEKISLDLTNYTNGIYYVKISSDSATEVIKVVKQ